MVCSSNLRLRPTSVPGFCESRIDLPNCCTESPKPPRDDPAAPVLVTLAPTRLDLPPPPPAPLPALVRSANSTGFTYLSDVTLSTSLSLSKLRYRSVLSICKLAVLATEPCNVIDPSVRRVKGCSVGTFRVRPSMVYSTGRSGEDAASSSDTVIVSDCSTRGPAAVVVDGAASSPLAAAAGAPPLPPPLAATGGEPLVKVKLPRTVPSGASCQALASTGGMRVIHAAFSTDVASMTPYVFNPGGFGDTRPCAGAPAAEDLADMTTRLDSGS
mmetsp:Transcript_18450/g.37123  ORF Transcript_18450/g.37123 Transcript_18450/m.37123 type:complete len:271 (+) Transcript_18450:367-1179(+)